MNFCYLYFLIIISSIDALINPHIIHFFFLKVAPYLIDFDENLEHITHRK